MRPAPMERHGRYSAKEDEFISRVYLERPDITLKEIARLLGRPYGAVRYRVRALGLQRRNAEVSDGTRAFIIAYRDMGAAYLSRVTGLSRHTVWTSLRAHDMLCRDGAPPWDVEV